MKFEAVYNCIDNGSLIAVYDVSNPHRDIQELNLFIGIKAKMSRELYHEYRKHKVENISAMGACVMIFLGKAPQRREARV